MRKINLQQWPSSRSAATCVLLLVAAANGANEHEGLEKRARISTDKGIKHGYLYDCPETAPRKASNGDIPGVSANSM